MNAIIFDLETNGLLDQLDRIHCFVIRDATTGEVLHNGRDTGDIRDGHDRALDILRRADLIIGHNVINFDLPALQKVFPDFTVDESKVRDTLILSRVLWPEIRNGDYRRVRRGEMPSACLARPHSLKTWGYRLRVLKGSFGETTDWSEWSQEMQDYCVQDTEVTLALWRRIQEKGLDSRCIELEHRAAFLCQRITRNGFPFDVAAAGSLYAQVEADKAVVEAQLQEAFPPKIIVRTIIPKVNNSKLGYRKGIPCEKTSVERFNPGSREQIAERLIERYGWVPTQYTEPTQRYPNGQVQIDEPVLEGLPYPEAKLLLDYLLLEKRAASLAGTQGWLKLERNGLIHGEYQTAGAVTGRATHSRPNIAQVTKKCPRYGKAFRKLFRVHKGWKMVGVDMSGLELRCLAHYLATFDGGAYALVVTQGDVHTVNQAAAGLLSRDQAKTFIYAFLYGAGAWKLGHIVDPIASDEEKVRIGTKLKARFLANTPGIKQLVTGVGMALEKRGNLKGLDGRPLTVRSKHAALNTLLQSAGAILCKRWIVECEAALIARGLKHGWDGDFVFLAWVHDEIQIAARNEDVARIVAEVCTQETTHAGEYFGLLCPLAGEAKGGGEPHYNKDGTIATPPFCYDWSETH